MQVKKCGCLNDCGDDPRVKNGTVEACTHRQAMIARSFAEVSEAHAMRMLWDDQSLEEKEHYLGVVRRSVPAKE